MSFNFQYIYIYTFLILLKDILFIVIQRRSRVESLRFTLLFKMYHLVYFTHFSLDIIRKLSWTRN